jgi:hypothetical protein
MLQLLHFRDSEKILKNKNMLDDVLVTMEYIDDVLTGSLYKRELLRMALEEMDWVSDIDTMRIIENRRYMWKGIKRKIAIDGSFSAYEYIIEGMARLQIGFDSGKIEAGVLMLTAKRGEKSPYGSTVDMVKNEVQQLYPTISLPVSVVLFNLGEPDLYLGEDENGVSIQKNDNERIEEAISRRT